MNTKSGIEKWLELDGDNTLALDWPLNEDSHVWEIGGFEGRWAQQIWDKFHCHVTIFEPQSWAVMKMGKRFEGIGKIEIRPYGLWTSDAHLIVGKWGTDGATMAPGRVGPPLDHGYFKNFYNEIVNFPHYVEVALMNIEGAEYTLLPEMINVGAMTRFGYFWCQFHPRNPEEVDLEAMEIFKGMEQTHEVIWNCYPTAVAWKKR